MSDRARTTLFVLIGAAFVVSVIHYVDNVVNYDAYPVPGPDALLAPSAGLIAVAWFVFTAFGAAGLVLALRGRFPLAAVALAVYSGSGLIGFGHYTVDGAFDMVWWRQAHIVIDIALGIGVLSFALWLALRGPHRRRAV